MKLCSDTANQITDLARVILLPARAIFAPHCYTVRKLPPNSSKTTLASRTRAERLHGFTRARKPEERSRPRLFGIECRSCEVCHTTRSQRSSRGFGPFTSE